MFQFFTFILSLVGIMAVSYGVTSGAIYLASKAQAERERRRKHEDHVLTVLTRIADNTEAKS